MNPWILHVKNYAQRNDLSYGCALSTPECKEEYQQNKKPKEQDYTKQIYKVADLMRSKLKAEVTQAFNALLPKIKALGDSVEKDRQMGLMSALRKGIGKLQSPTS